MTSPLKPDPSLDAKLQEVCSAFQCDWQNGDAPSISDYLTEVDGSDRTKLLRELLQIDMQQRQQRQTPRLRFEYEEEFCDDRQIVADVFDAFGIAETVDYSVKPDVDTVTLQDAVAVAHSGAAASRLGDYELLHEIARGGMGVVFKARQTSLNRIVALKMIKAGELADAEEIRRFQTEAEAAAKLDHPHIVPVHEVGEENSQHYFSMGFVDGAGLNAKLKDGPLPERDAAELTQKIASAVQYAHERGIVHRDLKPGNVLIDTGGEPRVTDFGLAKTTETDSSLTATGQVMGTPSYMPPEQAAGRIGEIGPLADVYSLGALLYCLLTGRPPFQAANVMDTLMQVMEQEPVPPRQLNPSVSRDLETICLKCLSKEKAGRYQSATELAEELGRYLNGQPILARPIGVTARLWRWWKRNPVVAGLSGAVAISLIAGTITSTVFAIKMNRNAIAERKAAQKEKDAKQKAAEMAEQRRVALIQANDATKREKQTAEAERAARQKAEQLLYVSQIRTAKRHWQDAYISGARNLLKATNPALRGWEYDYLTKILDTSQQTLQGQNGAIKCVALSPDGTRIVCGNEDSTVKIWDIKSGRELRTLKGHRDRIVSVAFSPDGKRIGSRTSNTVKIWDAESGRELRTLKGNSGYVCNVAFSPSGRRIISDSGNTLKVWETETGRELRTLKGHTKSIYCVAYSPDGTRIVSGSEDRTAKIWDAETGRELLTLKGHTYSILSVAFSPDGKRIVASEVGGKVKIWEAETGRELLALQGSTVYASYSPDGRKIVGRSRTVITTWDAETGQELRALRGHTAYVSSVAFGPDGRFLVSGSADGTIKIWDAEVDSKLPAVQKPTVNLASAAFRPDWRRLATGHMDGTVRIWDTETGRELRTIMGHTGQANRVAFSPDGRHIVSVSGTDRTVKIWDAETGRELRILRGHIQSILSVAFSPDGRRIVSGSQKLIIWDAESGLELLTLRNDDALTDCVAFSPDGRRIVTGSRDRLVNIWDAQTGSMLQTLRGHNGGITCVAFSPDGRRIVSGSADGTAIIWDTETGRALHTLQGHTLLINSIAFSPDGRRIVSGTRTAKIWDTKSGSELLSFQEHAENAYTYCIAFSPDGSRIASVGHKYELIIWDSSNDATQRKKPIRRMYLHSPVKRRDPATPEAKAKPQAELGAG